MLLFAAVFREAHATLMDSEKHLAAGEAAEASDASASDVSEASPPEEGLGGLLGRFGPAAIPDVQVSIGTVAGSAFGSSLPQSSSSGESAASASGDSAEQEEELWVGLCKLDAEQLTAVIEDAGAVLGSDGTLHAWLRWRRDFFPGAVSWNPMLQMGSETKDKFRRFVPAYADIFDAVETWMDEKEGKQAGGWDWQSRKVWDRLENWRWRAGMVLVIYEILFGFMPFVLTLELSSWARFNLWAYLVLHSAAFLKIMWTMFSFFSRKDESLWKGNFAETDLLLVSIAVLVRKRRQDPSSFPRLSLLNLLCDARCVCSINAFNMGINNLIPGECPHGTATIVIPARDELLIQCEGMLGYGNRGVDSLESWQLPVDLLDPSTWRHGDITLNHETRLAPKPGPHSSNP